MRINRTTLPNSLPALVDAWQASGRYVMTRADAIASLSISEEALKKSVQRLAARGRVVVPRRGFYVIVPLEYRGAGAPPPSWYIDALMHFHGQPYYVGLLSAAALHGAAHQQAQEFQVITTGQLRPVVVGRSQIRFFRSRHVHQTPTVAVKTETGTMRVSTPEATALDLLTYLHAAGHLGHVATVLGELAEVMDGRELLAVARTLAKSADAQRLGLLLDRVGAPAVAEPLAEWIAEQRPRFVPLRADRPVGGAPRDPRWRVLVNEDVEVDS